MILVDTSIWIQFFNKPNSIQATYLEGLIGANSPLCINSIIEMEILMGIKSDRDFRGLVQKLEPYQYFPDFDGRYFKLATEIYRKCRRRGRTIRRGNDCLIAANALIDDLKILHFDRDFEAIKAVFPQLATVSPHP